MVGAGVCERLAVALAAWRVRDETRALLRRRCNMEILEGYGVTEAAPVPVEFLEEDGSGVFHQKGAETYESQ